MSKSKSEAKAKPAKRKGNRKDRQRPPAASEPEVVTSESMPDEPTPDDPDELILAAIIAGGMASGRRVAPSSSARPGQLGHLNGYGINHTDRLTGPMCAVGAGVVAMQLRKVRVASAQDAFARAYDVEASYAGGVSLGFECPPNLLHCVPDPRAMRGIDVGNAAFEFFHGEGDKQ